MSTRAYIAAMRGRLGLETDDSSRDDRIEEMTPTQRLRLICGWQFGDETWADLMLSWARDCGFEITDTETL